MWAHACRARQTCDPELIQGFIWFYLDSVSRVVCTLLKEDLVDSITSESVTCSDASGFGRNYSYHLLAVLFRTARVLSPRTTVYQDTLFYFICLTSRTSSR